MSKGFVGAALLMCSFFVMANDDLTNDVFEDVKYENSPQAQYTLGMMYLKGQGVIKDKSTGLMWLKKSSDQGYYLALHRLGKLYIKGEITNADPVVAVKHITQAAQKGYSPSQYLLGTIYQTGQKGVAADKEKAARWFSLAAGQGHQKSVVFLAKMAQEKSFMDEAQTAFERGAKFLTGDGVSRDYAQAADWFSKAAEQGNADAQYNLGELYNKGRGVERSKKIAQKWYQAAAQQGHVKAKYRTTGCAFC